MYMVSLYRYRIKIWVGRREGRKEGKFRVVLQLNCKNFTISNHTFKPHCVYCTFSDVKILWYSFVLALRPEVKVVSINSFVQNVACLSYVGQDKVVSYFVVNLSGHSITDLSCFENRNLASTIEWEVAELTCIKSFQTGERQSCLLLKR